MSQNDRISLSPVTDDQHPALAAAKKSLGFVPNMYRAMATAPGLLESYLHGYEQFRNHSGFTPAQQEVVFLTLSRENACHYCMAAHSMLAEQMSQVPADVTAAIRNGVEIGDAQYAALHRFTKIMWASRGQPSAEQVAEFLAAGFSERQILDIITALAVKTLSNYTNHLFDTDVDHQFAAYRWQQDD
ncbi:MAG: carboxymuconolactone decarboxylase family protein [Methylococcales bacterium]|nr:carboxymuconolactone decarboxylase family protein [Methylococcales bacterium]